jgi:carbon starvation protein
MFGTYRPTGTGPVVASPVLGLAKGGTVNSLWLVVTALAAFAVAYRYYGAFLAARVAVLNDARVTPAHRLRDDVDYHPTRRLVLFGVHFAAIAGPGPLVGPVLASQWGYFPGFAWIVVGACLAGGVHDFVVLLASVRQDGMSLPKIARNTLGPISGATTTLATLFIVIATLAGVAKVVVIALSESAWGMFTIVVTIPAALVTGLWMNKIRPGRVAEASLIGVTLVLLGVFLGKPFDDSSWRGYLLFTQPQLAVILPVYAAIASILPVWVLLCPRDYLSSYMKIGVIVVLTVGIFAAAPVLKMPATTSFMSGNGPVVPGAVWPFVCIVIMCGALSGFHALVGSGTTPKMLNKESDIRPIGYGAMLLEGFVSITALVAACSLEPGDYFKINISQDTAAQQARYAEVVEQAAAAEPPMDLSPKEFDDLQKSTGENNLAGKTGGAVTLAVGMSKVLTNAITNVFPRMPGLDLLMAYWYHFVIMFEALFILTLLETGTRVARFIFQETIEQFRPRQSAEREPNWVLNVVMSVLVCFLWGGLLYTGSIASLWRMLGIANQLLATIALAVGTSYLLSNSPKRIYALCTGIPLVFVVATVFTAGVESIRSWWQELGSLEPGSPDAISIQVMSVLASIMLVLSGLVVVDAVRRCYLVLRSSPAQLEPVGVEK